MFILDIKYLDEDFFMNRLIKKNVAWMPEPALLYILDKKIESTTVNGNNACIGTIA